MLHRISVSLVVLLFIGTAYALDYEALKPRPGDLDRIKKFESLQSQESIEKARKYEGLKENMNLAPVIPQNAGLQETERSEESFNSQINGSKEAYLFYLISKSVPSSAISNIFMQAKKLKGVNFYGVLRGVDSAREVLSKMEQMNEFNDITIKVNPLIFRNVGAEVVPAFVYAVCPPRELFRSAECEYRMIVYGDMTLLGALEKMGDHDHYLQKVYEELKNDF